MQRFAIAIATFAFLLCGFARAHAGVVVTVDKSAQRLSVSVDGSPRYQWPISTARWGYRTPNGTYRPERLERKWFSRKYDWSPMPYSIFFNKGYAIHGSYEISHLGRPASHGCIRLHPKNAAILFALVKAQKKDTQIVVTGDRPAARRVSGRSERTVPIHAPLPITTRAVPPTARFEYVPPPATFRGIFGNGGIGTEFAPAYRGWR
jgi:L,D-transpeptidase catalytic domain